MRKRLLILAMMTSFVVFITGCEEKEVEKLENNIIEQDIGNHTDKGTEIQPKTEEDISENVNIDAPAGFTKISSADYQKLPDTSGLKSKVEDALEEIGVQEIVGAIYGNYEKIEGVLIVIDTYVVTDMRNLIVRNQYLSDKWSVTYINDADIGNMYYPVTGKNAYDYVTGECINPQEETEELESELEEEIPHRDDMYGISDKDIHDIDGTLSANIVRNDVTGKWRISTIAADVNLEEYALSYYNWKFRDNDEVHGIVNFNYNTTTCITTDGFILYVDVHEYVEGEEHDANLLFSGMLLKQYFVYLDNGDIEEIQ